MTALFCVLLVAWVVTFVLMLRQVVLVDREIKAFKRDLERFERRRAEREALT